MRRPLIVTMPKKWSLGTITAGITLLAHRQAGLHGIQTRQIVVWDMRRARTLRSAICDAYRV